MLLHALNQGRTVAFIGSGVSIPFGYLTWEDLAFKVLACTLQALNDEKSAPGCVSYIESLQRGAQSMKGRLQENALMFVIGACKSALEQNKLDAAYHALFKKHFAEGPCCPVVDLFAALLNLPIRRFVTTNYDCEIERALSRCRQGEVTEEDFGLASFQSSGDRRYPLSFTPKTDSLGQLALFALAGVRGNENMVFHCHGRFDAEGSIVATEVDYQRLYLGQGDGISQAFQQNVEFILGSNPLLFIGYGLRDEDLLRPLRQFGVLDPARKDSRPIFALLPCFEKNREADLYYHEALVERFGLHVISYPVSCSGIQVVALCDEIRRLGSDLKEAHREWSEKPVLKKPGLLPAPPQPYHEIEVPPEFPTSSMEGLEDEIRHPGVVVLVGPSGSSKSLYALRLVKQGGFVGSFYWNAHYANEAVTAVDYALSYFDPNREIQGSRYERIARCLREHRYLLVLDGCERLLRKGEHRGEGISYSVTFRRLLSVFADPRSQSTVVLASRLWPADLDLLQRERKGKPLVRRVSAPRAEARDLLKGELFAPLLKLVNCQELDLELRKELRRRLEREISALCSLLRGHSYGLYLAGKYLKKYENSWAALQALENLNRQLGDQLRDQRLAEMILLQLRRLDGGRSGELAQAVLERLAVFLGPVCEEGLKICFEEACHAASEAPQSCKIPTQALIEAGLLLKMNLPDFSGAAYTVHSTARGVLFQNQQGSSASLPAFGLSGFTSGRVGVDPDLRRGPQIKSLFDRLLERAEEAFREGDREKASDLCRDAFGLIRTRMEANTAPRWCKYDRYVQFPLRVAVLAKLVAPDSWTYCEHGDAHRFVEDKCAPLYPAELAWLYNDIAIALSAHGCILDACSFWEQTYEICRVVEDPAVGGGFHMEVLLSLAFTFIEMGRLPAACRYLEDAERLLHELYDEDYQARLLGLRGLILHLRGDLQGADELYSRCLDLLRQGTNPRAQSIFLKHKADVKISVQAYEEADLLIRNSRALAESGVFPELAANARMSEGHRLTRKGQAVQARVEYRAVLKEAQRIGFRKLEVRALTALARLALDQKDPEGARDQAVKALSLANELGLGLRQSHALVVLGLATLETDQKDLGVAYLRRARQLANDQEYWSRSREAENKLLELGVNLD
ncbi:MAG TPA: SIR2 family protein [Thermoanaerobaculia bacterium]